MKRYRFILLFVTGLLCGLVLAWGMGVLEGRSGPPGGETLLLPLMAMLVWVGYQLRELLQPLHDKRRRRR